MIHLLFYLTVVSAEPEATNWPSAVMDTDKTLSVCPSNVLRTPPLSRFQLLRVLSQEDETMLKVCRSFICPPPLTMAALTPEMAPRWPLIVTSRGPPGTRCKDLSGRSKGGLLSSMAAVTTFFKDSLGINIKKLNTTEKNEELLLHFKVCLTSVFQYMCFYRVLSFPTKGKRRPQICWGKDAESALKDSIDRAMVSRSSRSSYRLLLLSSLL